MAEIRDDAAEGVGDAGAGGHQYLGDAEFAGDGGGVQRAGAAESEEGEVARVFAEADRDHAHGIGHAGVGDADHGRRGLQGREPSGVPSVSWKIPATCSTVMPPSTAARRAGSSRPSRRLASEMVGAVPPRP